VAEHDEHNAELPEFGFPTETHEFADLTEGAAAAEFEPPADVAPEADAHDLPEAPEEEFPGEVEEEGQYEELDEEEEAPPKRGWWSILLECMAVVLFMAGVYWVMVTYTPNIWISSTIYTILMASIFYVLFKTWRRWTKYETSAPYTVILAMTLAAVLTGIFYLRLELASYDDDWKAEDGRNAAKAVRIDKPPPVKVDGAAAENPQPGPDAKPADPGAKPAAGGEKPADAGEKPAAGGEKPPADAVEKPAPGDEKPAAGGEKPGDAGEKPPAAKN
jgi:hypothetical protein